ncbi:hypothetical protein CEXT_511701 [Caerostris extrusa]|uniref:Uncharacterized protein n=1 Tax=Caerostris extrusa TaxID=172846 RepID=A0AAV4S0A5_CAEEX|nr:hypothetical protein CEXT_511701 [Caerostris extrusa]
MGIHLPAFPNRLGCIVRGPAKGTEGKVFCARCSAYGERSVLERGRELKTLGERKKKRVVFGALRSKQSVLKDGSAKRLEDFKETLPNNISE